MLPSPPSPLGAPASAGTGRRERKAVTPERHLSDACRMEGGAPNHGLLRYPPLERVMGIEPTPSAWKAEVLPLNYTRLTNRQAPTPLPLSKLVEGEGFEPPKAEPSDLQSDPFDHSGTPPTTSYS